MTLTEFLLARIAEDEAVATAALDRNGPQWTTTGLSIDGRNLGARIEGEREPSNPRAYDGDKSLWDDEGALGMYAETAVHVVRWDPARVLAESGAKRRIVEMHTGHHECVGWEDGEQRTVYVAEGYLYEMDPTLRLLALPYAGHPEYDERWRP